MTKEDYYYEEIDLMDYVQVILKWRWLVLGFLLVALATAFTASEFLLPEVYEVTATLEVGSFKGELASTAQLAEKIEGSAYLERLDRDTYLREIEAESPKGTSLVRIKAETTRPKETEETVKHLTDLVLADHEREFAKRKEEVETEIESLEKEIEFIKRRKTQTESIAPLYLETVKLKDTLSRARKTKIIKGPEATEGPVSPDLKLNLAVAGTIGLFSGILTAFVVEWWRSYEEE